jgi:E3 ubiquitin-protein ligase CCNP1IP1
MYDQLRSEYESNKRSAIQPANNFFSRNEPDLFSNPAVTMMDNRDPIRKGNHFHFKMAIGQRRLLVVP